ncbi:unnamed protein product [Oreochromis niloticus]|nr:unnamed protein product [Mustela putorius furo]
MPSGPSGGALASLTLLRDVMSHNIQNLTVRPGDSVTLQTGLTGLNGDDILWIYGSDLTLLLCDGGEITRVAKEYAGRLQLDQSSGCLTIFNIRKSAVFRGEMLKGNKSHNFDYNVTVVEAGPPFNSAADPGSLWGLVMASAVCCVLVGS